MKRIKLSDTKWLMLLLMCMPLIASCSKEDLPAYEEAEITKVGAYHRFYSVIRMPSPEKTLWLKRNWTVQTTLTPTTELLQPYLQFLPQEANLQRPNAPRYH